MKRELLALVLGVSLLFLPYSPSISSLLPSVVRITDGAGSCSAFSIDDTVCYYLTAAHCAAAGLGEVIMIDHDTDIAVIRLPECTPRIPLARSEPALGEKVHILGYPGKQDWPLALTGHVAAVESGYREGKVRNIFHEGVGAGMSGGPIINSRGEAVGVVSEGKEIPSVIVASPTVRMLKKIAGGYWQK